MIEWVRQRPRVAAAIGIASVLCWFLLLAHRALSYGFNPDDLMLMDFAIARPLHINLASCVLFWNGYIRPMGTLFYLIVYRAFGYWAPPFRIAAFLMIALNLVLIYRFALAVTKQRSAAILIMLLCSFHGQLWDIYSSTGTVYDLLCQCFCLLAITAWIESGHAPPWRTASLITILTMAAVESKEMGVAIPAVLLASDILFRPRQIRYAAIMASGAVSAVFLLSRFTQTTLVTGNPAFTPVLTLPHFLKTTAFYFSLLFNTPALPAAAALASITLLFSLAIALRSRIMLLGASYYVLTLLPLCFAPARSGYVLYVPFTGAAMYLVALFFILRDRLAPKRASPRLRPALTGAFALWILFSQFFANRKLQLEHAAPGYLPQVEAFATGLRRAFPALPHGSTVTLVNDPFGNDSNVPKFAVHALYNDPSLQIRKIRWNPDHGLEQLASAPHAILFANGSSWRFGSKDEAGHIFDGRPLAVLPMRSALAALNIVRDIGDVMQDGSRWALGDPELIFGVDGNAKRFTLDYVVPDAILKQTGPLHLSIQVGNFAPQDVTITQPGPAKFSMPLVGSNEQLLRVRIHAHNPYIGSDGSKLSFLLTGAGVWGA